MFISLSPLICIIFLQYVTLYTLNVQVGFQDLPCAMSHQTRGASETRCLVTCNMFDAIMSSFQWYYCWPGRPQHQPGCRLDHDLRRHFLRSLGSLKFCSFSEGSWTWTHLGGYSGVGRGRIVVDMLEFINAQFMAGCIRTCQS